MEQRPEPPPEGQLIADAADHMKLSIREAARRAGISYGRWRQIVTGYQNVSHGSYAPVHAPAKTLARMAAVVGVTADEMETQGQRADAAEFMRQDVRPEPARPVLAPSPRREPEPRLAANAGLESWRQQVLRQIYTATGLIDRFGPGELPEPSEVAGAEEILPEIEGAAIFDADHEVSAWDNPRMSLQNKVDTIARLRMLWARADEENQRRTGTALIAGSYPLICVAGTAARASH